MSIPNVTLVSACYYLGDYNPHARTIEQCLEYMKTLLSAPCYMVIFCNKRMEPHIRALRDSFNLSPLTLFVVQEFEDLWTYGFKDRVIANRASYWPTRDARAGYESHLICCNRFDFVQKAIQLNPFKTPKFGWIDANLGVNASKICETYENHLLLNVLHNIGDKYRIQILNVVDKKLKGDLREYYKQYRWLVCGCFFTLGVNPVNMIILERLKECFVKTTEAGYGHADEMLYLEILDEFYEDIDRAYGDYKHILHNFISPMRGHDYIYRNIVQKHLSHGHNRECFDAAAALIGAIESYQVPIRYDLYVKALFDQYVASFYCMRSATGDIVKKIRTRCETNPYFREEFEKNGDFYNSQLAFYKE